MNRKSWLLRCLKFVIFAALFVALAGYVTMRLWNWLVPELFHGPSITLAQTYGLLLLSRMLVGFRGGHGGGWGARQQAWKQRMADKLEHLSPEDREKLRAKMARHCGPAWMRNRMAPEQTEPAV